MYCFQKVPFHLSYQQNCGGCCCDCCCCCCCCCCWWCWAVFWASLVFPTRLFSPNCCCPTTGAAWVSKVLLLQGIQKLNTVTLPKTNMSSKNRPSQKDGQVFQASISRCENVSFREGITSWREKTQMVRLKGGGGLALVPGLNTDNCSAWEICHFQRSFSFKTSNVWANGMSLYPPSSHNSMVFAWKMGCLQQYEFHFNLGSFSTVFMGERVKLSNFHPLAKGHGIFVANSPPQLDAKRQVSPCVCPYDDDRVHATNVGRKCDPWSVALITKTCRTGGNEMNEWTCCHVMYIFALYSQVYKYSI